MGSFLKYIDDRIEAYSVKRASRLAELGRNAFRLSPLTELQRPDSRQKTIGRVAAKLGELGYTGRIVQRQDNYLNLGLAMEDNGPPHIIISERDGEETQASGPKRRTNGEQILFLTAFEPSLDEAA